MPKFALEVSYTQIAVFDPQLESPFNDWRDEHIAQGFSWRPGSVSFGTLESAGQLDVEVITAERFNEFESGAMRAVAVPFVVSNGEIEIATISESRVLKLPNGNYELIFEHGFRENGAMWAKFYFHRVKQPIAPKIFIADAELSPPEQFMMNAEPA